MSRGPTLKKGDKVYLLNKNFQNKRLNKKLDSMKLEPFQILIKVSKVNYRLRLLEGILRVNSIFHVCILKLVLAEALLNKVGEVIDDLEYEVQLIVDEKKDDRTQYKVYQKRYLPKDNTQEPRENLERVQEVITSFFRSQRSRTRKS